MQIYCEGIGRIKLNFLPVSHLHTLPSFGFIFESEEKRCYYSGDANDLPESVQNDLEKGKLNIIYQDTCGLDYDGNAHLSLKKLCEVIPENLRKRIYCIHHDSFLDVEKVQKLGFNLPEIYNR